MIFKPRLFWVNDFKNIILICFILKPPSKSTSEHGCLCKFYKEFVCVCVYSTESYRQLT